MTRSKAAPARAPTAWHSWLAAAVLAVACATSTPAARDADGQAAPGEVSGGGEVADAAEPLEVGDAAPESDVADVAGAGDASEAGADVGPGLPLPPPGPGFHVAGREVLDAQGRALLLHGISVCNTAKYAPDFLPWHGPADLARLAELGFDHVRLLTFWAAIMPREGEIDGAYLDAYAERVAWAAEAGLLVVVDMHQDVFGVGFGEDGAPRWACDEAHYAAYQPTTPWFMNYLSPEVQACFDAFWSDDALFQRYVDAFVAMALRVRASPAVLGFELINEPNWGSQGVNPWVQAVYQPRMEQLAAALGAVAPDKLIFLQGTQLSSVGHVDPFVPFAAPRTVFAPHYYHPLVHDGGSYDRATMRPQMEAVFDKIASMADLLGGLPLWMGEMGGPTESAGFGAYLVDLLESLERRGWGFATYSDDPWGGFAIRTAPGAFKEPIVASLGHACARRVPGPVLERALDLGAGTSMTRFTWTHDAPLELWVGRTAPGGVPPVVSVTREGAVDDASLTCSQAPGRAPGTWTCPAVGEAVVFGAVYRVTIARADAAADGPGAVH